MKVAARAFRHRPPSRSQARVMQGRKASGRSNLRINLESVDFNFKEHDVPKIQGEDNFV